MGYTVGARFRDYQIRQRKTDPVRNHLASITWQRRNCGCVMEEFLAVTESRQWTETSK